MTDFRLLGYHATCTCGWKSRTVSRLTLADALGRRHQQDKHPIVVMEFDGKIFRECGRIDNATDRQTSTGEPNR